MNITTSSSFRQGLDTCPIRNRLTGVKRHIFNPDLPTLRCMERHDTMCKLPEEHCRHTTRCTSRQFADAHNRPFKRPDREFPCLATVTGKGITKQYNTLESLQEKHKIWATFLKQKANHSGGNFRTNLEILCDKLSIDDWHFDGVMLRVSKPELRDWRLSFKCEPGLDRSGRAQRVTPSDTNQRHRRLGLPYNYTHGTVCTQRF